MGFNELDKLEKKGKAIRTTSPVQPAAEKKATVDNTAGTSVEKEQVKEEPKAPKRDWGKIWEVFKSDNVFKDNEA